MVTEKNRINRYLPLIAVVLLSVAGLVVRIPLRDFLSGDSRVFLLPWYDRILNNGMSRQVGNYNLVYQLLIFLMTRVPLKPLYAYKALSVLFDYALAASAGVLTGILAEKSRKWKGILAYGLVLLSPIVVLNSAAWAQCDSIYACFAVLALIALIRKRELLAVVLMGVSFSFKLQAVFLLPLYLFVFFYRRKKTALVKIIVIPVVMVLMGLPMVFFGRNIMDIFSIYADQTTISSYMTMNYPSIWLFTDNSGNPETYTWLKWLAIGVTVAALGIQMLWWIAGKAKPRGTNLLCMAFILSYLCVFFLPSMHERYGYIYEILALVLAVLYPKTAVLCAGLTAVTCGTYFRYLRETNVPELKLLAICNLAFLIAYLVTLNRRICKNSGKG